MRYPFTYDVVIEVPELLPPFSKPIFGKRCTVYEVRRPGGELALVPDVTSVRMYFNAQELVTASITRTTYPPDVSWPKWQLSNHVVAAIRLRRENDKTDSSSSSPGNQLGWMRRYLREWWANRK